MAKKKQIKALLSIKDKIKIIDRNMTYTIKGIKGEMYIYVDENGVVFDNIGIVGIDNAIEKSKSVIKL